MGIPASMLSDGRGNTIAAWALVGALALTVAENLLDGDLLWAGFAIAAGAIAVVPAAIARDHGVMVPWEVLVLVVLPVGVRSLAAGRLLQVSSYLSVAALALLIAVELDAFTAVEMTAGFAVAFVVVATMATAGTWVVVQWFADRYLGTGFLTTADALMWDLVFATLTGIVAGIVFEIHFHGDAFAGPRGERG